MIPKPEIRVITNDAGCELCVYVGDRRIGGSLFISWNDYDVLCDAVDSKSLSSLPMASQAFFEGLNAVLDDALLKLSKNG